MTIQTRQSSLVNTHSFADDYDQDYFEDRHLGQDPKREQSYRDELSRIHQYVSQGNVLDVGCGMGDFLTLFDDESWQKYGIEISEYARDVASSKNIKLIDYDGTPDFFDLIIFRGTFQHLDQPLYAIQRCIAMLKPGGHIIFLATPNTSSICYRLFGDLPMLDPKRNFVVPSDTMLSHILTNFGLEVLRFEYPYLESPYSNPIRDHIRFLLRIFGIKTRFAFWKNTMECYARKKHD